MYFQEFCVNLDIQMTNTNRHKTHNTKWNLQVEQVDSLCICRYISCYLLL